MFKSENARMQKYVRESTIDVGKRECENTHTYSHWRCCAVLG